MNRKPLSGLRLPDELSSTMMRSILPVTDVDLERVEHRGPEGLGVSRGEARSDHDDACVSVPSRRVACI